MFSVRIHTGRFSTEFIFRKRIEQCNTSMPKPYTIGKWQCSWILMILLPGAYRQYWYKHYYGRYHLTTLWAQIWARANTRARASSQNQTSTPANRSPCADPVSSQHQGARKAFYPSTGDTSSVAVVDSSRYCTDRLWSPTRKCQVVLLGEINPHV